MFKLLFPILLLKINNRLRSPRSSVSLSVLKKRKSFLYISVSLLIRRLFVLVFYWIHTRWSKYCGNVSNKTRNSWDFVLSSLRALNERNVYHVASPSSFSSPFPHHHPNYSYETLASLSLCQLISPPPRYNPPLYIYIWESSWSRSTSFIFSFQDIYRHKKGGINDDTRDSSFRSLK